MRADQIVQFVCFETRLGRDEFIKRWELYTRSANCDHDVTLQQSTGDSQYAYISQHRSQAGEFQFVFSRGKRTSRLPEPTIRGVQAGGYLLIREERKPKQRTGANECKMFVFLNEPPGNLKGFKTLSSHTGLNVYEAYYENCKYAGILELFVRTAGLDEAEMQLKNLQLEIAGVYRECVLEGLTAAD